MAQPFTPAEMKQLVNAYWHATVTVYGERPGCVGGEISADDLARAVKSFATYDPKLEFPCLLIVDNPMWEAEGILLTNEHLFFNRRTRGAIALRRVETIHIDERGLLQVNGDDIGKIGNDHFLGMFLHAALVERRPLDVNDVLRAMMKLRGIEPSDGEAFVARHGGLIFTTRQALSYPPHPRWHVKLSDITDVTIAPSPVNYGRPSRDHPFIALGVMLYKMVKASRAEEKYDVIITVSSSSSRPRFTIGSLSRRDADVIKSKIMALVDSQKST